MGNRDKRLDDLERSVHGDGDNQIRVSINWHSDGLIVDRDTGERVTEEEWRRRHPNDRLITVGWGDDDWRNDDDQDK